MGVFGVKTLVLVYSFFKLFSYINNYKKYKTKFLL